MNDEFPLALLAESIFVAGEVVVAGGEFDLLLVVELVEEVEEEEFDRVLDGDVVKDVEAIDVDGKGKLGGLITRNGSDET
jgi:hypothetical protein